LAGVEAGFEILRAAKTAALRMTSNGKTGTDAVALQSGIKGFFTDRETRVMQGTRRKGRFLAGLGMTAQDAGLKAGAT